MQENLESKIHNQPFNFQYGFGQRNYENRLNNHVEKKEYKTFRRSLVLFVFPILIFIVILNLYVYQAVNVQAIEYKIKKMKQKVRKAYLKNNELKLQLSQKLSFSQIEKKAVGELGMEPLSAYSGYKKIYYLELPNY